MRKGEVKNKKTRNRGKKKRGYQQGPASSQRSLMEKKNRNQVIWQQKGRGSETKRMEGFNKLEIISRLGYEVEG